PGDDSGPPMIWRWLPAAGVAALIFALSQRSSFPRPRLASVVILASAAHLARFGALAVWAYWAYRPQTTRRLHRVVGTLALVVVYGITDEVHQSLVPGRHPSAFAVVVDAIGALAALLAIQAFERIRRERRARGPAIPNGASPSSDRGA